jgi:hypothetical protein
MGTPVGKVCCYAKGRLGLTSYGVLCHFDSLRESEGCFVPLIKAGCS